MGGQVSTIKAAAKDARKKKSSRSDKAKISILAFEVANVMSKCIVLWQSLSDQEVIRLRTEVIKGEGVLKLVSDSEAVLLSLACREKLQDLLALAGSVARLGKRCHNPALQGFEHVFNDALKQSIDLSDFEFSVKEMEAKVKKMERYIATTSNLYQELEILADLEQAVRRIQEDEDSSQRDNLSALEQKISWQRQEIKYLRDLSLWNRTYDKIVLLLAKTICTIHSRIVCVFGPPAFDMAEPMSAMVALNSGECNRFSRMLPSPPSDGSFLQYIRGGTSREASSNFVEACNAMGPSMSSSSPSSDADVSQPSPTNSDLRISISAGEADAAAGATASSAAAESNSSVHLHKPVANGFHHEDSSQQGQQGEQQQQQNASEDDDQQQKNIVKCQQQQHQQQQQQQQPQQRCLGYQERPQNGRKLRDQPEQNSTKSQELQQHSAKLLQYSGPYSGKLQQQASMVSSNGKLNRLFFDPKFIHHSAPSSTLGGSALALHYANVIIIVEKMVKFPQLVGNDARDDLYRMLPKSLRTGLRSRLRTCFRPDSSLSAAAVMLRMDSATAAAWREKLEQVLGWLAPLAHNMIRWQSEHNFEQQVVSRTNVLLLQTLYFADQAKAEAAIVELLVGLNYLCWYEKEVKANMPVDYSASKELDDYLDWQF